MITAVIITRNEEHNITRTLQALQSSLITEIIVSDSNSSDNTKSKVLELAKTDQRISFHCYTTAPFTAARGRHEGVKHIKEEANDFILFLDGDMELIPEFVGDALGYFEQDKELAWLSGQMDNVFYRDDGSFSHTEVDVYDISKQTVGGGALIKKEVYLKSKGFNPDLIVNEESELEYRFNKLGFRAERIVTKMFLHHTELPLSKRRLFERILDNKVNALFKNILVGLKDGGYFVVLFKNNIGFFIALFFTLLALVSVFFSFSYAIGIYLAQFAVLTIRFKKIRIALNYSVYALAFCISLPKLLISNLVIR